MGSYLNPRRFWTHTSRTFLCTVCAIGLTAPAQAADLGDMVLKAPPELPDLTWHGITVFGSIDVSGQYESSGAPYVGGAYTTSSLITPWNRSPQWLFAPNQELQSFWGIKVEEKLGSDLNFIARLESGFNPTTGEISDTLKATQKMNGLPLNQQAMNGDGARAGQFFNGEAWAGFDSEAYGTLKIGRNNAASLDMVGAYDPLASYGFSLLGYVGFLGGQGSAETVRIDDSIKYTKTLGPFRMSAIYGHPDTNVKDFYQGTVGIVYPNLSFDFLAGHANDEVTVTALTGAANLGSQFLGARVFDTDIFGAFGKYTFDLGRTGFPGAYDSKLTFTAGYSRLDFSNPRDGGYTPGHETIGGYQLGPILSTNGSIGSGIVNYGFTGADRIVNISFIAAKYQYSPQWSFAFGYYRYDTNSFGFDVNSLPGIVAPGYSNVSCSSSTFLNCSGAEQTASFRADYQWTKNLNLYAGFAYSTVSGGFAFSYLSKATIDPTIGMRLTF
jgi:predicted porin